MPQQKVVFLKWYDMIQNGAKKENSPVLGKNKVPIPEAY
jgi:hypothetical protein